MCRSIGVSASVEVCMQEEKCECRSRNVSARIGVSAEERCQCRSRVARSVVEV